MISIAKIGTSFGLSGKLNLYIFSQSLGNALSYKPWYIKVSNTKDWKVLTNELVNTLGKKLLIQLDGVTTKEKAKLYINSMIAVPRNSFKSTEIDEFYWVDLIGLKVINKKGDDLGYVDYILDTGSNEVLCCKKSKQEFLIPFIKNYVIFVDRRKKRIIVDWYFNY